MDVFLKKAAVTGLFESETELEVDFIDGVNCIHGINGSGKTVFINLLVGVLNCQVEYLRRIQFKSATIFILKGDNKRPTKMFTVSRESELIRYHFHIELESKEPPEIMGRLALIRGIPNIESIIKKGENIEISLDEDAFDMNAYRVRHILQQYLSATYVPLLRGHESAAKKRHRMHEAENDPYVNMLASLQEDFSRRFGAAHSSVNLELERLKSQMFERLLFDDSDSTIRQDMEDLRTMTRTGAINDYSTEEREQLTKEISDANIKIPQRKIERHFSIWRDTQEDVISTLAKLNEAQNTSNKPNKSSNENYNEEIARLHDDYSKAYFKCLASIKFHRKFKLAIDDIKLAQMRILPQSEHLF